MDVNSPEATEWSDLMRRVSEKDQQIARLQEALKDARSYVECVMLNASGDKKRKNYAGCLARIDAALTEIEKVT